MINQLLALFLTDAFLYVSLRILIGLEWRANNGNVPLWLALPTAAGVVGAHLATTLFLTKGIGAPEAIGTVMALFVIGGLPPIVLAIHMVMNTVVNSTVDGMYSWHNGASVATYDLTRARQMVAVGDFAGALREYLRRYEEDPGNPEALFAAAALLESLGRFTEAAFTYRRIIGTFPRSSTSWLNAVNQLAMLRMRRCDGEHAKALCREVVYEDFYPRPGRLAGEGPREQLVSA